MILAVCRSRAVHRTGTDLGTSITILAFHDPLTCTVSRKSEKRSKHMYPAFLSTWMTVFCMWGYVYDMDQGSPKDSSATLIPSRPEREHASLSPLLDLLLTLKHAPSFALQTAACSLMLQSLTSTSADSSTTAHTWAGRIVLPMNCVPLALNLCASVQWRCG